MNKTEIIEAMAAKAGFSKAQAKVALDAFLDSVTETLVAGDKVALIGFGAFSVAEKAERRGVNPATLQQIVIPAKRVVKFKPGGLLSEAVE
ncbi:MAG: HU family DNA-binding protein [Prevotellaceae bacterium]|jgi:DNA-binding protein HU-beta|nr:HU family DNA-binding protein [Prevotellaceae bacterium]